MTETSKVDSSDDFIELTQTGESTRNLLQESLDQQFPDLGLNIFLIGSSFAYKSQIKEYILGSSEADIDHVIFTFESLNFDQRQNISNFLYQLSHDHSIDFCIMFNSQNTLFSLRDYQHFKRTIKNILNFDSLIEPNLIGAIILNGTPNLKLDLMKSIKMLFIRESIPMVFAKKLFSISIYKTLMIPDKYVKFFDYPFLDPLEFSPEVEFVIEINRQIQEFAELKAQELQEIFMRL